MKLEVRHLELLTAIADEGNMTKAGERLNLTQSALSHQLRDIEGRLGTHFYLRLNKRMVLTQAGERLLKSARTVLDELRRTEEDIHEIALNREGILRISTECYTSYHWLPSMLMSFNQKHPRVKVQIVVEATRKPIRALLEGKIDVAIISDQIRDRNLLYKPIFKDELVVVMRPNHPLASRSYIRAHDFVGEHLISYILPTDNSTIFQKVLLPAGVMPKQVSQVQLTEAAVEMVKAGLGISVMARWAVAPQIMSGELIALPLTKKGIHRQWGAVIVRSQEIPPYLLEFVELLTKDSPNALLKLERRAA